MFLSYGIFMSMILYCIVEKCNKNYIYKLVSFIGTNTIWIYLYHMPLVSITARIPLHWTIRYFVVFGLATTLFLVHYFVVCYIQQKHNYRFLQYLKG